MYQMHWGLRETPFRSSFDPRFFYESPVHEEALARLQFLVDQRRRLGLLMGESGSGKSFLLEVFAGQIRRYGQPVAKVSLLGLRPAELLWSLAAQFGQNPDRSESGRSLWHLLTDRLAEYRYQQLGTVVLLDNADEADEQVRDQVTRLARHDLSPESRLTIVLAGRRERMGRLGKDLLELAELRIDVEPWEPDDTDDYLKSLLAEAGRESPIFDEPAVNRLHQLAHGIPRRISQLADLALLAGAGRNLDHVNTDVVESAYRELGVIEV